jgi:transposase
MMGRHARSEALFHYLRLEDQIPENHLLRLIERQLKDSYSETRRPSVDPELLLRSPVPINSQNSTANGGLARQEHGD